MEKLRYCRLLDKNLLYGTIPVFSLPILVVLGKAFLNLDLYFLGDWLIYYTIGSISITMTVCYILKKFPDRNPKRSIEFLSEISEIDNRQ